MNKTKRCFNKIKFILSVIVGLCVFLPITTKVQAETTFPVDQAGMAAYVKLASVTEANFTNAKQNLFDSVESFGSTYLVGVKEYSVDAGTYNKVSYHIYLGGNGWLVVYLTRDQKTSGLVNWASGAALSDTMLKTIIDDAVQKIGVTVSDPIKYYNFMYPEATKMTFIREAAETNGSLSNDFTLLVPGAIYQASYSLDCRNCGMASWRYPARLYLDNNQVAVVKYLEGSLLWGDYDMAAFTSGVNHTISINRESAGDHPSAETVILYKPE